MRSAWVKVLQYISCQNLEAGGSDLKLHRVKKPALVLVQLYLAASGFRLSLLFPWLPFLDALHPLLSFLQLAHFPIPSNFTFSLGAFFFFPSPLQVFQGLHSPSCSQPVSFQVSLRSCLHFPTQASHRTQKTGL